MPEDLNSSSGVADSEPIYRTVFQVEVFSRGPFDLSTTPDTVSDLAAIDHEISEGPCIGYIEQVSSEVVAPENVDAELIRIGNDGTFFEEI